MLWYLVLGKEVKEVKILKSGSTIAPELLCRLQKNRKVCRLAHSILVCLSPRFALKKFFPFRKAFPGQNKTNKEN